MREDRNLGRQGDDNRYPFGASRVDGARGMV
jgi:hypothetical protein